jgi:hypothetical protein
MLFFDILAYIVLSISVSFMWSFSEIFSSVRNLVARIPYIRRPLICPECSSFWMGFLVSFLYNPLFLDLGILSYPFCGLVTHLFACFLYKKYFSLKKGLESFI